MRLLYFPLCLLTQLCGYRVPWDTTLVIYLALPSPCCRQNVASCNIYTALLPTPACVPFVTFAWQDTL